MHPTKENFDVFTAGASIFGYHGWPSVCRGPEGELLAVCSGLRLAHVCPFGKVLLSRSFDEGRHWTTPEIVMDTPLDDRDAGVTVFGNGRLIVTSFNHYIDVQREFTVDSEYGTVMKRAYFSCGRVSDEMEKAYFGSTYVLSDDNGRSWSAVKKAPVTAPHGPAALRDGGLLYLGNPKVYDADHRVRYTDDHRRIEAWYSADGESWEKRGTVDCPIGEKVLSCEAHCVQLPDGGVLGEIRVQGELDGKSIFAVFQTESSDGGRSWSKARRINDHGSPPHLLVLADGRVVCTYGYRREPYGQRAVISADGGKSWGEEIVVRDDGPDGDLGYPATVQLRDGSLLSVYYQKRAAGRQCEIFATRWNPPEK